MTFTEQTKYHRSAPNAICQDGRALLKVREYSFDLNEEDFVQYFEERTGIMITWSPSCSYAQPDICSGEEWETVCQQIMNGTDTSDRLLRGRLEDAWELWNKQR